MVDLRRRLGTQSVAVPFGVRQFCWLSYRTSAGLWTSFRHGPPRLGSQSTVLQWQKFQPAPLESTHDPPLAWVTPSPRAALPNARLPLQSKKIGSPPQTAPFKKSNQTLGDDVGPTVSLQPLEFCLLVRLYKHHPHVAWVEQVFCAFDVGRHGTLAGAQSERAALGIQDPRLRSFPFLTSSALQEVNTQNFDTIRLEPYSFARFMSRGEGRVLTFCNQDRRDCRVLRRAQCDACRVKKVTPEFRDGLQRRLAWPRGCALTLE